MIVCNATRMLSVKPAVGGSIPSAAVPGHQVTQAESKIFTGQNRLGRKSGEEKGKWWSEGV